MVNYKDHFKMIFTYNNYVNDIYQSFNSALLLMKRFEKLVQFDANNKYGYITSCPSLIGQGLEIFAQLNIKNLVTCSNYDLIIKNLKFDSHSHDTTNSSLNVSHKAKLSSSSEYNSLSIFYWKLSALYYLEEDKGKAELINSKIRF